MQTMSTRRFELGLPLFSGLDLGGILQAKADLEAGKIEGLSTFMQTLGKAGELKVLRKLGGIWTATDLELKQAESSPEVLTELASNAADRPFAEVFGDAMAFQSALWASLGLSVGSSEPPEKAPSAPKSPARRRHTASPSEE